VIGCARPLLLGQWCSHLPDQRDLAGVCRTGRMNMVQPGS
jgi:hypothetical protein